MTDKEYIDYAKAVHEEAYAMSTPMIDGIAGKVLTRIRKEQVQLMPLKEEWTSCLSATIDVVDVLSVLAHKGKNWTEMNPNMENILDGYITDRYNELESKHHFILKYRYVGESKLKEEVKARVYERLKAHYDTQRFQNLLERYADLNEL